MVETVNAIQMLLVKFTHAKIPSIHVVHMVVTTVQMRWNLPIVQNVCQVTTNSLQMVGLI